MTVLSKNNLSFEEQHMHHRGFTPGAVCCVAHLIHDEIIILPKGTKIKPNMKCNVELVIDSPGGSEGAGSLHLAREQQPVDLIAQLAPDERARMMLDWYAQYPLIRFEYRKAERSSVSTVIPDPDGRGMRQILKRMYLKHFGDFPRYDVRALRAMYGGKYNGDCRDYYLEACRDADVPTFLDLGDGLVPTENGSKGERIADDVYRMARYVVVAEEWGDPIGLSPVESLHHIKALGPEMVAVTLGERGVIWCDEKGKVHYLPAHDVPAHLIVDPSGCGDVHNIYAFAYRLQNPEEPWVNCFRAARGMAAYKLQCIGHINLTKTLADVRAIENEFPVSRRGAEMLDLLAA